MQPILMVAYYYPPAGGAGVQRTLKFSRYLPQNGWRPHLLVPENADYPVTDPSLLAEIPEEAVVHHSRIVEPYGLYRRLTGRRGAGSLDVVTLSRGANESARLSERFSEWLRATFFIPDARIGWYPFAARAGLRVVRAVHPTVLYSSAPPYTCHLIGRRLHRATGIPWVADFRDSWVDWLSAARRSGLSRRIELAMEGSVLREATAVLTVSRGVGLDLFGRHPDCRRDHWHVLPNGFDPNDLQGIEPRRGAIGREQLLITYSGTLYGPRNPETLVEALEQLSAEGHPSADAIRIRLIGRVGERIWSRIWKSAVASHFERIGYVGHAEAVAITAASDVLLLIVDRAPQSAGILTGKLFEYLGIGKPILALAPEGEAVELVRDLKAGWHVVHGDVAGMRARLLTIWDAWRRGACEGPNPDAVRRFSRQEQTAHLAELLDGIA